jgi:acyl-CoA reductase-like NAD-dependent aldehyde dehydrogenase
MGTIISRRHLDRIAAAIERRSSGDVLAGGERMLGTSCLDGYDLSRGYFFPPTVVADVEVDDELWREEIFGPVVAVRRFVVSVQFP